MKLTLVICTIVFFLIFISCNIKKGNKNSSQIFDTEMEAIQPSPLQQSNQKAKYKIPIGDKLHQPLEDSIITSSQAKTISNPDWDKKIIKTATLKLEVKDFKNYNDNIHQTIKQFGAYIAQEEQNSTNEKSETVLIIKVPVENFEAMMNQLPGNDDKVLERKITSEDVTGKVVDTRLRLEAKKGMRLKYLEFLKQSKNMEEVLQVQNQINTIQEEMESAAGRVEFLSHQSGYSTINCTFFQPINGYKPLDGPPSYFTRISIAFKTGTVFIGELFIGLISIWPLLLAVVGIYIGWKKLKPSKVIPQNS